MNSVNLIGKIREKVDEIYRIFEYERPYEADDNHLDATIPVRYWTNQSKNILTSLPENSRVAIHGHLDTSEKFATILIVEQIQILSK